MASFIMITVVVFIAALGISYFSRSGSRKTTTRNRSSGSSADSYFYPGVDPNIADSGSRHKNHPDSGGNSGSGHHQGHHHHQDHGHHHGGSSWDSGSHHSSHGGSDFGGGGDSGGGDSGGGGGD